MSLLKVPSDLEALLATPGRDWTDVDRLRIVEWLNEPVARGYLLRFAGFHLARVFRATTISDAEDAWSSFFIERLGAVMRLYDPGEGAFVPFLLFAFGRECGKTAQRLRGRSDRSAAEVQASSIPARAETPEQAVERQETARWLRSAIAALPATDREVIVLHYFENKEVREIADALGVSVNTAKVRLFRARRRLATSLPAVRL